MASWLRSLLMSFGVLIALAGSVAASHAQPRADGPLQVCVLRDDGSMRAAELIRHPERFDCTTPQHQLGNGDFWAVSSEVARSSSAAVPLVVQLASLWQRGLDLHVLYADGAMRSAYTGPAGVAPLIQLGAIVEQPIPVADAPVVRLLWHVRGAANVRGVLVGPQVIAKSQSDSINLAMAALYAGFAGVCGALILYNLALWNALRHPFQLYYCAMVATLLAYVFTSSGVFAWMFPDIPNNDRLRLNYLMLAATGATAVIFARSFFEPAVFAGWLGRWAGVLALAVGGAGVMVFIVAPFATKVADIIFTLILFGIPAVALPILVRAWRVRSAFRWLFAIGWGAPLVAALLRIAANFHLLPWSFWLDNSTTFSMIAEVGATALAIAYRIKLLRAERDEAIAREVTAWRMADTDPLTGLFNRRAFLNHAIGRAGEQQLLVADLDHFKYVNETLGHDGGDDVLRLFAQILRDVAPADALVARIGGEEFAILAPADAALDPETLLAGLRAARMPFDLRVTASIGICRGPIATEMDWKSLYRGADSALFAAKSAGRDTARSASREVPDVLAVRTTWA